MHSVQSVFARKMNQTVCFIYFACAIVVASWGLSIRNKRQIEPGNRIHYFPFKELCAEKLNTSVSQIHRAVATGVPSPYHCSYFALQCQTTDGNVSRHLEQCGVGMWWNFWLGTCQPPSMANRLDCVNVICPWGMDGILVADKRACYGFYECRGTSAHYEFCEEGGFNPLLQNCVQSSYCAPPTPRKESCTEADLPRVCTTPGYIPNMAYCGCIHENWEM